MAPGPPKIKPQREWIRRKARRTHEVVLSSDVSHDEDETDSSTPAVSSEDEDFDSKSPNQSKSELTFEAVPEQSDPELSESGHDSSDHNSDHNYTDESDSDSEYTPSENGSVETEDSDFTDAEPSGLEDEQIYEEERRKEELTEAKDDTAPNTKRKRGPYTGDSERTRQRHAKLARERAAKESADAISFFKGSQNGEEPPPLLLDGLSSGVFAGPVTVVVGHMPVGTQREVRGIRALGNPNPARESAQLALERTRIGLEMERRHFARLSIPLPAPMQDAMSPASAGDEGTSAGDEEPEAVDKQSGAVDEDTGAADVSDKVTEEGEQPHTIVEDLGGLSPYSPRPNRSVPPAKRSPALDRAVETLTKKHREKYLGLEMRDKIGFMLEFLHLYRNDELTKWTAASETVAKAHNRGPGMAWRIRRWVWDHIDDVTFFPRSTLKSWKLSAIVDEDIREEIKAFIRGLGKPFFTAEDIQAHLNDANVMEEQGRKKPVTVRTVRNWLKALGFWVGKQKRTLYFDGHESEAVRRYRKEVFIPKMKDFEKTMAMTSSDLQSLTAKGLRPLVLVTHDESVFFQNDQRQVCWQHNEKMCKPLPKGDGKSVMVSDFCSPVDGFLTASDGVTSARVLFKPGKNREGYFDNKRVLEQTKKAIDVFEDKHPDCTAVFAFDNATTHTARAKDSLSAKDIPKLPKLNWRPDLPRMRDGWFYRRNADGDFAVGEDGERIRVQQSLYDGDTFKGSQKILVERGHIVGDLRASCTNFKCKNNEARTQCCLKKILYLEPDFSSAKSALEELVESRGHHCIFYPKYHCELNFIDQVWGYAKLHFREMDRAKSDDELQARVTESLARVTLESMQKYCIRAMRFKDAYDQGLTAGQAIWAAKKYRGHRCLPPEWRADLARANVK